MRRYFILIILLAAFLRISFLGLIPEGLYYKESTLGWRVQNLLEFGKDEFGRSWPLLFSNWKDLELPVATYLSLPFIAIAPTDIFYLRLPFALGGIFAVIGSILLTERLIPKNKIVALLTGFVMSINPWTVWLSRLVSYEILALALIIWGIYFFLGSKKENILGLVFLILSVFTSKIAIFFLIPFGFYLFIKYYNKVISAGILIVSFLSIGLILSANGGLQSFKDNDFTLLFHATYLDNINLLRGQAEGLLEKTLAVLFFNKSFYLLKILENFLSVFNPSFLFAQGDGFSSHNPSNFGPLLLVFLPFLFLGLIMVIKEKVQKIQILTVWMILSTFPTIFLTTIHTDRLLLMIYPISVFIAWSLSRLNKPMAVLTFILILFNIAVIAYDLDLKEPQRAEDVWHKSTIGLIDYVDKNQKIWLTDNIDPNPGPAIAYLLKYNYNQSNLKDNQNTYKGWVSRLDNLSIGDIKKVQESKRGFEKVISSKEEKNPLNCILKEREFNVGKNSYEIYRGCNETKY